MQKYELLALFPLSGTEDELKASAVKVEERLKSAGATVAGSQPLSRGLLAYPVAQTRQGYYHTIQFELEPQALAQLRRDLTLAQDTLRFSISSVSGAFKPFMASAPRLARPRFVKTATAVPAPGVAAPMSGPPTPVPTPTPSPLAQETVKPDEAPKVTMEEIDKRLEEILGKT